MAILCAIHAAQDMFRVNTSDIVLRFVVGTEIFRSGFNIGRTVRKKCSAVSSSPNLSHFGLVDQATQL